jgi:NCS2 family nucleobase:cation symporter-2
LPPALSPLLHSGILLASVSAVVLNLIFNGVKSEKKAQCEIRSAGHDFDGRGGSEPRGDDMLRAADVH